MKGPLQHLLITVKVLELEKVFFSDTENAKAVKTFTVDEKHYLLNKDNLLQPIQMKLSQKTQNNLKFFFAFLKSISNFKHLPKAYDPHS